MIISQDGKTINGYVNHYWNGVTCLTLAKIIDTIIKKKLFWSGIKHIHSPKSCTKYQLLLLIIEKYKLNIKVNKFKCKHSCNRILSSVNPLKIKIQDIQQQIQTQL